MRQHYGILFSADNEFKILAIWIKVQSKETLWDFANRVFNEKFKDKYEHYDTMSFETLEELNDYIVTV